MLLVDKEEKYILLIGELIHHRAGDIKRRKKMNSTKAGDIALHTVVVVIQNPDRVMHAFMEGALNVAMKYRVRLFLLEKGGKTTTREGNNYTRYEARYLRYPTLIYKKNRM